MIKLVMEPISAGKIIIPGGWTAKIPEITIEDGAVMAYARYVMRRDGLSARDAEQVVRESHQGVYNYGFRTSMYAHLRYRARQYHTRYGSMDGFDPVLLLRLWMPGENVGRPGKPFARTLMAEMAKTAKEDTCPPK